MANPAELIDRLVLACRVPGRDYEAERNALLSALTAASPVPTGYRLVPEETNFDLTDAFCEAWEAEKERMLAENGSYAEAQMFKVAWKALLNSSAMLSASPPAPLPAPPSAKEKTR